MNKKTIFWATAFLTLGITGFLLWRKYGNKSNEEIVDGDVPIVKTPKPYTPPKTKDDTFPLKIGSKGSNVEALQNNLKILGAKIKADGDFGKETNGALIGYFGFGQYPVTEQIFNSIHQKAKDKINYDGVIKGLTNGYVFNK